MFLAVYSYGHLNDKGEVDHGKCGVRVLNVFDTRKKAETFIRENYFSGSKLVRFTKSLDQNLVKYRASLEDKVTGYQVVELPKLYQLMNDNPEVVATGTLADMKAEGEKRYKELRDNKTGKLTWRKSPTFDDVYDLYDGKTVQYAFEVCLLV